MWKLICMIQSTVCQCQGAFRILLKTWYSNWVRRGEEIQGRRFIERTNETGGTQLDMQFSSCPFATYISGLVLGRLVADISACWHLCCQDYACVARTMNVLPRLCVCYLSRASLQRCKLARWGFLLAVVGCGRYLTVKQCKPTTDKQVVIDKPILARIV